MPRHDILQYSVSLVRKTENSCFDRPELSSQKVYPIDIRHPIFAESLFARANRLFSLCD